MKKKGGLLASLRLLGYLTQFGLSVIMPPLLLTLLGWWLTDRYGIGVWLIVLLLIAGLISSGCSIYRFFKVFIRETRDEPYGKAAQDDKTDEGKGDSEDEV